MLAATALLIMRIIILILCLFAFDVANCCTCQSLPRIDNEQYGNYDFVATGMVSKIVNEKWQRFIYLEIDNSYKGGEGKGTIQIISPNTEGECGISPKAGERWLMYAYKKSGKLHTSLCTRTKSMNPNAWDYNKAEIDEDIAFLNKKQHSSFSLLLPVSLLLVSIVGIVWWMRTKKSR